MIFFQNRKYWLTHAFLSCSTEFFAFQYKGLSDGMIRRIVCILRGKFGQSF